MTVPAPASKRLHLDHIDGMRAVAALVVYWNHAYAQVTYSSTTTLQGPWSLAKAGMVAGHLAVTVFIVLSGFCLTLPVVENGGVMRGTTADFLKRRAKRILPPYYAALVMCLLLIATIIGKETGSVWDYPVGVDKVAVISHFLLLQDLFGTSRINYVFWSIAVEWQIYFLMPPLVWAARRFGLARVVVAAVLLGYAIRLGFADTRITRMNPHFFGMFTLGMLAAHVVRGQDGALNRLRTGVPWSAIAGVCFGLVCAVSYSWGAEVSDKRFYILDLPVGIMTLALLVRSAEPGFLRSLLCFRPLVFIGTFSYSVYLIHAPWLQVLWQYGLLPTGMSKEANFVALMTVGLGIVLLLSYVFFLGFEAPFLRNAARSRAASAAPKPATEPTVRPEHAEIP